MPITNVADEAIFKEWDERVVRATTTAASLDAAQASGNISKTQSTTMSNDPLSQEIGSGDRPRCQEAMGGVIAQTRSKRSSKHSYDSPLPGGNTPGSDEGRPNINELMAIYTNLSNKVLALEQLKTAQDLVIRKLKKKVRKLEKKLRARTLGMKLFKIGTSKKKSLDEDDFAELDVDNAMENVEGDAETQGRNTAEQITTNGDTVNTTSIDVSDAGPSNVRAQDQEQPLVIRDVEEEPRRATPVPIVQSQDKGKGKMVEPEPTPKNLIKAQIQRDAEIAQRLLEEEKAELEQEEASNAPLIAEFDNVQVRIEADALLPARLQEKKEGSFLLMSKLDF
ncbi:hypothetical protein Tco_0570068 [Tanacetum coccineum]